MNAFEVFCTVMCVAGGILIGFDIYLFVNHQKTISEETIAVAKHAPIFAFGMGILIGVLAGHFFWQIQLC